MEAVEKRVFQGPVNDEQRDNARARKITPESQCDEGKDMGLRSVIHQDNFFIPTHQTCMQDGDLCLGIPQSKINCTSLLVASGAMLLLELKSLYPGFRAIYQKHFDDARFNTALRLNPHFKSQKLRLLCAQYFLEGNFHHAQQMFRLIKSLKLSRSNDLQ